MFWIYVPPIILVVALASLAVMLGRKSADLKKIKTYEPQAGAVGKRSWRCSLW